MPSVRGPYDHVTLHDLLISFLPFPAPLLSPSPPLPSPLFLYFLYLFHTQDLTVGQFVYVIRKRIKLAPEKAIFIFVEETLPPTAALMSAIYEEHK